jgi:hypothetical protein
MLLYAGVVLLPLLVTTTLSNYKPRDLIGSGWREQQEEHILSS